MDESNVPKSFFCPITSMVMRDPVVDLEGNTYERSAIEEWLSQNSTSPVTRQPLRVDQLNPNRALKDAIDEMEQKFKSQGVADPFASIKMTMQTQLPTQTPQPPVPPSALPIEISKEQLVAFYEQVAPDNVVHVPQYLQTYAGRHNQVWSNER